jgi:hypothetical protein
MNSKKTRFQQSFQASAECCIQIGNIYLLLKLYLFTVLQIFSSSVTLRIEFLVLQTFL